MTSWLRIDAEWFEDERIERLGADTAMFHLSALAHCARQASDGRVSRRALRRLWPVEDVDDAVDGLLKAGVWKSIDDGYLLLDWQRHILSHDEIERRREWSRMTSERNRRHHAGDHSVCGPYCWFIRKHGRDAVTRAVSDSVSDPLTVRNDPVRDGTEWQRSTGPSTQGAASTGFAGASPARPQGGQGKTRQQWADALSELTGLRIVVGNDCPHVARGWTWVGGEKGMPCRECARYAHLNDGADTEYMAESITRNSARAREWVDELGMSWQTLAMHDALGVTLALGLTCVVMELLGPVDIDAGLANGYAARTYCNDIDLKKNSTRGRLFTEWAQSGADESGADGEANREKES